MRESDLRSILLLFLACIYSPLSSAIERVISLAPSSTELAYAAGLGKQMIAVSAFSDYPEEAKSLEKVAAYNSINIERIIALNPDLIVAWRSGASLKSLKQLEDLGFEIFYTDTEKLTDIASRIEELGKYSNNPEISITVAKQFRDKLHQLQSQHQSKKPIPYFYQLSGSPIFTIAQSSWPSEVFELCGGINIFEQAPSPYPQVGLEQVLAYAPEIIFTSAHAVQDTSQWMIWQDQVPAVANNRIWSLNADWLNRPTPRSLYAVEEVCKFFDKARQ
ncbi:vitamin B12 ABC transporter substrate-binding protein BtuF [Vibrio hannami]|uniref:vitamin B12 ABC transporter substrate-binding protein BtuF n=1 Tax=Vibrio hannami TaxID=2717094 RepID=UPI0024103077|nr:vitamin B12 ABC transporter substrate-binding protein BtuF [Vibrio hannami]MDG3089008.1 vitamin B12 ABC transporter substrate-binding protein BtuF [Vibrio hannami]